MSDWSVDGVVDNTWASLDEVTWIDCEDKGDCTVPGSRLLRPTSCILVEALQSANGESLQQLIKPSGYCYASVKEEQYDQGNAPDSNYVNEGTSAHSKGVACCDSTLRTFPLNTVERAAGHGTSALEEESKKGSSNYVYERTMETCKGESEDYSNGPDILNSSCHFFPSASKGDLEFLAEEGQEDGRRDNLLEYGWGNTNNMEDIEKLFPSIDSILTRGFDTETDGMLWEPRLGDSLGVMDSSAKVSGSPEFVSRGDMEDMKIQVHFSPGNHVATLTEDGRNLGVVPDGKQEMSTCLSGPSFSTHMDNYSNSDKHKTWDVRLPHNHRSSVEYCKGSNNEKPHSSIDVQKASRTSGSSLSLSDSEGSRAFKEGEKWKTSKARRQGSRSKRLEENSRKPSYARTTSLEPIKAPHVYVSMVSTAQESPPCSLPMSQITRVSACETAPPLQCLQPIPYLHAGFGFPAHHMPAIMVPGTPPSMVAQQRPLQAQPIFISYQPQPFIEVPKSEQCKSSVSSQSPSASSTMTPQEKIEKLRWRQKMQAQLAIEQQQQQLISQRLIPEQANFARQRKQEQNQPQLNGLENDTQVCSVGAPHAEPSVWNERPVSTDGASVDNGDESLAVSVLQQLLNIASKMDSRTRLCLRDGFCRLARNAMQRRVAGDRGSARGNTEPLNRSSVAESSASSEQACSQRLLTVEDIVETETNPMDRFIADFLFHKRCPPPSCMPSYVSATPPCNISQNSQPTIANQAAWACQGANPLSPGVSPATRSSSVNGDLEICKSPNVVTDTQTSPCQGLCPGKVIGLPQAPAMGSMQYAMDRDTDMIDVDPALPAMVEPSGNVESLNDVDEPLLQAE